jgi:integrase
VVPVWYPAAPGTNAILLNILCEGVMTENSRLTEGSIKRATVDPGNEMTLWDGEIRGLGVRMRNLGGRLSKTWVIKYRNEAKAQRKLTLGEWPGLTVVKARKLAKGHMGDIAKGDDPARDRRKTKEAGTVAALLDRFLKDHVKAKGRSETTEKEYRRLIEKVIKPTLGKATVAAVDRNDVARWFTKLADTPRQANHALSVLSKAMSLAEISWGLRPEHTNPCRGIDRYKENQRDRHPSAEEYEAIGSALVTLERDGKVSSTSANVIRVLALTGFRLSEACNLEWSNVDTKAGVITLGKTKSGKGRTRMVGTATLGILATLDRPKANDDAFVFPGATPREPISKWIVEKAWQHVRAKTKAKDLRLHDLRHGVGTVAAGLGANAFQVRDKLGHATLQMTGRYVSKQDDPLKELSERAESQVDAAMKGGNANITTLSRARNLIRGS